MPRSRKIFLQQIYQKLLKKFGPQFWWPAPTRFEVIIGAILTQNTNWANVEKALTVLKDKRLLSPQALYKITPRQLASCIKPAGYFNVKAKRIKNFIRFLFEVHEGKIEKMRQEKPENLRSQLLCVNGIGAETADSILLYALDKPFFVVDAYTKRILSRHGIISPDADYATIQQLFMTSLRKNLKVFNEYHALIVRCAKEYCKKKPLCEGCPLEDLSKTL